MHRARVTPSHFVKLDTLVHLVLCSQSGAGVGWKMEGCRSM